MFPLYTDINFNGPVTDGLIRRGLDVLRAQDDHGDGVADELILDRSTELKRVLLTHDTDYFSITARRLAAGASFVSVLFIDQNEPSIGACIEDVVIFSGASLPHELWDVFQIVPFK